MSEIVVSEPCGRVLERISQSAELQDEIAEASQVLDAVISVEGAIDDELGAGGRLAVHFDGFTCVFARNQRTGKPTMLAVHSGQSEPSGAAVVSAEDF